MPYVRWQDANETGVEALTAAIEELDEGGGTEDFDAFETRVEEFETRLAR